MLHYVSVYMHSRVEKLRNTEDPEEAEDILKKLCLMINVDTPDLTQIRKCDEPQSVDTDSCEDEADLDETYHGPAYKAKKRYETRESSPFAGVHSCSVDRECHQPKGAGLSYEGHNGFYVCAGLFSLAPLGLLVLVSIPGNRWERMTEAFFGGSGNFLRIHRSVALYSLRPP